MQPVYHLACIKRPGRGGKSKICAPEGGKKELEKEDEANRDRKVAQKGPNALNKREGSDGEGSQERPALGMDPLTSSACEYRRHWHSHGSSQSHHHEERSARPPS